MAIKVSRGEENIFIWCFFLAIVQLALDGSRGVQMGRIRLHRRPDLVAGREQRDHVGNHLVQMLSRGEASRSRRWSRRTTRCSSTSCNEIRSRSGHQYFLKRDGRPERLSACAKTGDTPFLHHVRRLLSCARRRRRPGSTRTTSTCCAHIWRRRHFLGYDTFGRASRRTQTIQTASSQADHRHPEPRQLLAVRADGDDGREQSNTSARS